MTHESVRAAVQRQYAGDWDPITKVLLSEISKMLALRSQGRPYLVPSSTQHLAGGQLDVYIGQTRIAVSILNCLKNNDAKAAPGGRS